MIETSSFQPANLELNGRGKVFMPFLAHSFVVGAINGYDGQPPETVSYSYTEGSEAEYEKANIYPAISSTYLMMRTANRILEETLIAPGLTERQQKLIPELEWTAADPDHHFKSNLLSTYPTFALGFVWEAARRGHIQSPHTVDETVELMKAPWLKQSLLDAMGTKFGVWQQSFHTDPWQILRNIDFDGELFGVDKQGNIAGLSEELKHHLRSNLTAHNKRPDRMRNASGCPVLHTVIRGISDDETSARHLTPDQKQRLTSTTIGGKEVAHFDESGNITITIDLLDELQGFYVNFVTDYVEEYGVPVLTQVRDYPHRDNLVHLPRDTAAFPRTKFAEPDAKCFIEQKTKQTTIPYFDATQEDCTCESCS